MVIINIIELIYIKLIIVLGLCVTITEIIMLTIKLIQGKAKL